MGERATSTSRFHASQFSLPSFSMRNIETISPSTTGRKTRRGPFLGRKSPEVSVQFMATCAWFGARSCLASRGTSPEKPLILNPLTVLPLYHVQRFQVPLQFPPLLCADFALYGVGVVPDMHGANDTVRLWLQYHGFCRTPHALFAGSVFATYPIQVEAYICSPILRRLRYLLSPRHIAPNKKRPEGRLVLSEHIFWLPRSLHPCKSSHTHLLLCLF